MNSSLIGKIEKAKRYATEERDRIRFEDLRVHFDGANGEHEVTLKDQSWHCTCDFFTGWGLCSHSMALERILDVMLSPEARNSSLAKAGAVQP
jgi:hypothetical protein